MFGGIRVSEYNKSVRKALDGTNRQFIGQQRVEPLDRTGVDGDTLANSKNVPQKLTSTESQTVGKSEVQ